MMSTAEPPRPPEPAGPPDPPDPPGPSEPMSTPGPRERMRPPDREAAIWWQGEIAIVAVGIFALLVGGAVGRNPHRHRRLIGRRAAPVNRSRKQVSRRSFHRTSC
jgi:hypothetical protein